MSTTKIVHGYRSKAYHEVMVCSSTEKHAKENLVRLLKDNYGKEWDLYFLTAWEYFTMEVEFPDGSKLDDSDD